MATVAIGKSAIFTIARLGKTFDVKVPAMTPWETQEISSLSSLNLFTTLEIPLNLPCSTALRVF